LSACGRRDGNDDRRRLDDDDATDDVDDGDGDDDDDDDDNNSGGEDDADDECYGQTMSSSEGLQCAPGGLAARIAAVQKPSSSPSPFHLPELDGWEESGLL
jgi:hypothetical protein